MRGCRTAMMLDEIKCVTPNPIAHMPIRIAKRCTSYITCNMVFKVVRICTPIRMHVNVKASASGQWLKLVALGQMSSVAHRRRNGGCTGAPCPLLNAIQHLFSLRIGICSAQIGRLHWCRQLGYHSDKGRLISTYVHLYGKGH